MKTKTFTVKYYTPIKKWIKHTLFLKCCNALHHGTLYVMQRLLLGKQYSMVINPSNGW